MTKKIIYILAGILLATSCITNDLPYPVVVPHITSIEVEDAENVEIDYDNQIVTVYIQEHVNPRHVVVRSVEIDQAIAVPSIKLEGIHDLSTPLKFKLKTYDDYEWTLRAIKNIDRYFTVEGQIGSTVIDPLNCRAIVNVGKDSDISNIKVNSLKLGPEGLSTYSMDIKHMNDFTHGIYVDVTAFDITETWGLFVEQTDVKVSIVKLNPWSRKAYVTSYGVAGVNNVFEYREKGTEGWIPVDQSCIEVDGGTFTACIEGLLPQTIYEVVAVSGEYRSAISEFTTDSVAAIPNGSFEYVSKVAGKDYYKFYDPGCGVLEGNSMFWGSGNGEGSEGVNGSANLGIVITYVDTVEKVDGKQSVRAQTSQMAGILAAGNLFTGQFAGLVGTSGGMVNFGRPWTTRPTALKLYCKYVTANVDIINGIPPGVNITKADFDRAQIKFAIGNWPYKKYGGSPESPVLVNTTDSKTFVNFATDASTIAHGDLVIHHDGYVINGQQKVSIDTGAWIEYTIPLQYHDLETRPTHIIISCAASQYGDYFTGCSKSRLWLDAVELIY